MVDVVSITSTIIATTNITTLTITATIIFVVTSPIGYNPIHYTCNASNLPLLLPAYPVVCLIYGILCYKHYHLTRHPPPCSTFPLHKPYSTRHIIVEDD